MPCWALVGPLALWPFGIGPSFILLAMNWGVILRLLVALTDLFACGFLLTAYQPRVREKLTAAWEARDVLDLIQQDQGENLSDASDRAQQMIRLDIVRLRLLHQLHF